MSKHRLTTNWANRGYVVYVNGNGAIYRCGYDVDSLGTSYRGAMLAPGSAPGSVVLGDTFGVDDE